MITRKTLLFRKSLWVLNLVFFLCGTCICASPLAYSEEMIGNEQLLAMIGEQSHSVMKQQRRRLRNILEGFLIGDWGKIKGALNKMIYDIERIEEKFTAPPGYEIAQLKALQEIKSYAEMLKSSVAEKNYEQSYQHFSNITLQCIKCHQAQRTWGNFEGDDVPTSYGDSEFISPRAATAKVEEAPAVEAEVSVTAADVAEVD